MAYESKPWVKNYDTHVPEELDPELFETPLIELFMQVFKEFPDKLCARFLGVDMTFSELDRYSNQFANMLIENGIKPGDVVGISLVNTPQYLISYIGSLKVGCAVSGLSPLFSAEEIKYQLNDANATALVCIDAAFAARIKSIAAELPKLKVIIATNIADFLPGWKRFLGKLLKKVPSGKVTPLPNKTVLKFMDILKTYSPSFELKKEYFSPDSTALLMYTGGTTGFPKGSILINRNVVSDNILMATWLQVERGKDTAISGFPFFHIGGTAFCNMCLYQGVTQLLVPNPRDTDYICDQIAKFNPTMLVNVPTLYQMLLNNPKFKTLDFSALKFVVSSAAPFPVESINQLESTIGKNMLIEVYGATEMSPIVLMNPRFGAKKLGTVGMPLPNIQVKLVDPATNKEVPIGEAGEVAVKGPPVMKGYLNKPEENKSVFDIDGYFHTGDVAIMDEDGYFRIVDRVKDMIIVGGYKVYSSKVEDVLAYHPAVDIIALVGVPNPERPGSELVKAYIQLKPGINPTEELKAEIISFAKEKLTPYEVPKIIEFREELPLTAVGKVYKKELRAETKKI